MAAIEKRLLKEEKLNRNFKERLVEHEKRLDKASEALDLRTAKV